MALNADELKIVKEAAVLIKREMLAMAPTEEGEKAKLTVVGFGKFTTSKTKPRVGRNLQTGEPMPIASRLQPSLSFAKGFLS